MNEEYYKSVLHRVAIAYELDNKEAIDKWLRRIYEWSISQRERSQVETKISAD